MLEVISQTFFKAISVAGFRKVDTKHGKKKSSRIAHFSALYVIGEKHGILSQTIYYIYRFGLRFAARKSGIHAEFSGLLWYKNGHFGHTPNKKPPGKTCFPGW